jgi:hypothetical protein
MSTIITALNVNHAMHLGLQHILSKGQLTTSRGGRVLVSPGLVVTEYINPLQRVLFSPTRDANPFFHIMEAIWMLSGGDDVEFPSRFNSTFGQFSDNGSTFHGAYGRRWRSWFGGLDQLSCIVNELLKDKTSRRAVLGMFDPYEDQIYLQQNRIGKSSAKDLPCNTHCYFDLRDGQLNMTICCRSNDVIWGAYGANAVHFSVLMEFIAAWLNVPVGIMRQLSNNFHVYIDRFPIEKLNQMAAESIWPSCYEEDDYQHHPMFEGGVGEWEMNCRAFTGDYMRPGMHVVPFFADVILPINVAWQAWRNKNKYEAIIACSNIQAKDWRIACCSWIMRHFEIYEAKEGARNA